ncbi:enoyl-[acyl-carrier-protein] reductase, mitochondrial [Agrilus planipennis]|uniref:Enoyl-[acyl-carrier-protein] reductase, mitochondrial n=1 Tax=Agrilus planipennis TaxID=224129 RepID=A0A1W4WSF4_AGRPL|nr:enoyl-[acyl-carrier-protein] reductase, mitochondrial [Agrilus planipennis]
MPFTRAGISLVRALKHNPNKSNYILTSQIRTYSGKATKLLYEDYGEPAKVVKVVEETLSKVKPNEVLVKILAAPVNPADINTIEGKYPSKPKLPAVPGNEGVGRILEVGSDVTNLAVGDHVVPLQQNLGTWRTHAVLPAEAFLKVPLELGLVPAATLTVNPCTAFRMLRDFVDLKPGDVVIQNGANSAVGQFVIQIARTWGIKTVNIVRNRPEIDKLKDYLNCLGASVVLTEEELRATDIFKTEKFAKPRLALNCVGGKSATEIMRHLQNSCPIVTYGGMSREPVTVATSALIFKDIQVRGFWMSAWSKKNATSEERFEMFDELICMMVNKELKEAEHTLISFSDYAEALKNTLNPKGQGKKYILNFNT